MPTLDTPTITERHDACVGPLISVSVRWLPEPGLDRLDAYAWGLRDTAANRRMAARLVKAIKAGVAVTDGGAYTDVTGARGHHGHSRIGRTMNADLRRLGF